MWAYMKNTSVNGNVVIERSKKGDNDLKTSTMNAKGLLIEFRVSDRTQHTILKTYAFV